MTDQNSINSIGKNVTLCHDDPCEKFEKSAAKDEFGKTQARRAYAKYGL